MCIFVQNEGSIFWNSVVWNVSTLKGTRLKIEKNCWICTRICSLFFRLIFHCLKRLTIIVDHFQGGYENLETARSYYSQAAKLNPNNARALYGLLLVRWELLAPLDSVLIRYRLRRRHSIWLLRQSVRRRRRRRVWNSANGRRLNWRNCSRRPTAVRPSHRRCWRDWWAICRSAVIPKFSSKLCS